MKLTKWNNYTMKVIFVSQVFWHVMFKYANEAYLIKSALVLKKIKQIAENWLRAGSNTLSHFVDIKGFYSGNYGYLDIQTAIKKYFHSVSCNKIQALNHT